jgi:hypothetical protein
MRARAQSRLSVTAAVLAASRLAAQVPDAGLLAADRAASRLSSDSGIAAMLAATFDSTGVLLWPGAPVVTGPAEANRLLGAGQDRDSVRLAWQPLDVSLARDSSVGVTWGILALAARPSLDPPRLGRYIAAWRREVSGWRLAALMLAGVSPVTGLAAGLPRSRPRIAASGHAAPFVEADVAFARLAGDSGAAVAFRRWAAPEALVFGGGGLLVKGPEAIGRAVDGPAQWGWHPVAAGGAPSGDLGWTVGEAVIAPPAGEPHYSKYLTIWIRRGRGPPRFLTDGGNDRPASR